MNENERTRRQYDEKYGGESFSWTVHPSDTCFEVLKGRPPDRHLSLLDIRCGEGRNAVFFARNRYDVHAFDISGKGLEKTKRLAQQAGVSIRLFQADLNQFRLNQTLDILFSTGTLHSCNPSVRADVFENFKQFTAEGGLNALSVFVRKPFIPRAPDGDANAHPWRTGDFLPLYHDWKIEWSPEVILDCMSSGVPHQHAVNRLVARKEISQPAV